MRGRPMGETVVEAAGSAQAPPRDPADVLVVDGVTMEYPGRFGKERHRAVDGLSLGVRRGEIVALLGRNGAGKSTLIRMISTITIPTSGTVRVDGHDVVADDEAARRSLGVVLGGERSVYWKLTGRQNLAFFAALRGLRGRRRTEAVLRALARVDLTDRADDYVEEYSTGMRQRLVIARALLGDPAVIVLDEPTAGLDPHATASLQELVSGLRSAGHAILLATHHIEEAELIADRVAVIDEGRLVAVDTPHALRSAVGASGTITCELSPPPGQDLATLVAGFGAPLEVLATSDGPEGRVVATLGGRLDDAVVARLVTHAVGEGWTMHGMRVEPVTLRHAFLVLTGHEITSDEPEERDDEDG